MKAALAVACLTLVSTTASAQESGSITIPSTKAKEVNIWNSTGQTLRYSTSCDEQESWTEYSAEPNATWRHWCNDENARLYISIGTSLPSGQTARRTYYLPKENKYRLFADASGVFDVSRMDPQ